MNILLIDQLIVSLAKKGYHVAIITTYQYLSVITWGEEPISSDSLLVKFNEKHTLINGSTQWTYKLVKEEYPIQENDNSNERNFMTEKSNR